jgi:HTH-type transcriptional regulator, sugar sensing transcriptional regulator
MNSNLLAWLESTGLDSRRANIYLTVLSLGEATAKQVAAEIGMGRTAVYDNFRFLEEKGYIKSVREGKRQVFVPVHPNELYKQLESRRQQLKDLLPDFLALYAEKDIKPFAQLFKGQYAAREVYEDILRVEKKEYVYFSPSELTLQVVSRKFMEEWVKRRVSKGIKSRSLRIKSKVVPNAPIFNNEFEYLRQIRYLHGFVDLKAAIYIYGNNIGVISTKREGIAFIIHSPDLAFSLKQIFEFIWQISTRS